MRMSFKSTGKNFFTGTNDFKSIKIETKEDIIYSVGQHVYHKKWGKGVITAIIPNGNDHRISILFDEHGLKNLLQSFAPLKVLENG